MDPPVKPTVSQKDYLKKYFSKSKTDKVKKKKVKVSSSSHLKRSQIIDDDLNLNSMANIDDDEFNLAYLGDEAPQIAGIVDERPDHIKIMEQYGDSKVWKSVGEESDQLSASSNNTKTIEQVKNKLNNKASSNDSKRGNAIAVDSDESPPRKPLKVNSRYENNSKTSYSRTANDSDIDNSSHRKTAKSDNKRDQPPSRKINNIDRGKGNEQNRKYSDSDQYPPRKSGKNEQQYRDSDSDQSLPRISGKNERRRRDFDREQSPPRKSGKNERWRRDSDSDQSPPRKSGKNERRKRDSNSDQSPPRKSVKNERQRRDFDSDQSPPRKSGKNERQRRDSDSDQSPPRKSSKNEQQRRDFDSDQSPSRKSSKNKQQRRDSDNDPSPPRKSGKNGRQRRDSDSDQSLPRKLNKNDGLRKDLDKPHLRPLCKSKRNDSDSDQSPPRTSNKYEQFRNNSFRDQSPPRKSVKNEQYRKDSAGDQSPTRNVSEGKRRKNNSDSDQSPPRMSTFKDDKHYKYDNASKKFDRYDSHSSNQYDKNSRGFKSKFNDREKKRSPESSKDRSRNKNDQPSSSRDKGKDNAGFSDFKKSFSSMETTLEGKKAGLQDAKNLRNELASLREQEDNMFKSMDSGKYGAGQEAIVRDRKTGRIKDFAKEQQESKEKMKERQAREEKYSRWGKGLKQIEEASSKAASSRYEMSKPLARYKDDNDLDAYLKAQEREGDPMLDFIKRNQNESHSVEKLKPRYEGSYGPNRFNIRPGHRWDGVDRSNGYETKWFASINAKKAVQEEAWKWSSSDM